MMKRNIIVVALLVSASSAAHSGALLDYLQAQGVYDETRANYLAADQLVPVGADVYTTSEIMKRDGTVYLQIFWQKGSRDLAAVNELELGNFIVDDQGNVITNPEVIEDEPLSFWGSDVEFEQSIRESDSDTLHDIVISLKSSGDAYYKNPRPKNAGDLIIETNEDEQGNTVHIDGETGMPISQAQIEKRIAKRQNIWTNYRKSENEQILRDLNKLLKRTAIDKDSRQAIKDQIKHARERVSEVFALTLSAHQILLLEDNQDLVRYVRPVVGEVQTFNEIGNNVRNWGNTREALANTNSDEARNSTRFVSDRRGNGVGVFLLDDHTLSNDAYQNFRARTFPLAPISTGAEIRSTTNHADYVVRHAMVQAPIQSFLIDPSVTLLTVSSHQPTAFYCLG